MNKIKFLKKTTSIIASFALVFVMSGVQTAKAASLTVVKDTLTGTNASAPSATPIHTINFTTATTINASGSVLVDFYIDAPDSQGFGFGTLGTGDVSASGGGVTWGDETINATAGTISFPFTGTLAASSAITLTIGGTNKVINPSSAGTYKIGITSKSASASNVDTINTRIAIISGVAVTAEIDSTLTFTILGTGDNQTLEGITTDVTTTATSVPFGSLIPGTAKEAAQILKVSTNANSGYTITVRTNNKLSSGSNDIDWFDEADGTAPASNTTPEAWVSPSGTVSNTNTGYLGYHAGDNVLGTGTTNRFATDNTYAPFSITAHEEVVYSSGPVTNEETYFVYKIEVNSMQPTGNYSGTTATFICTPTY